MNSCASNLADADREDSKTAEAEAIFFTVLSFICLTKSRIVSAIWSALSNGAMLSMPAIRSVSAVSPSLSVSARIGRFARKYSYNLAGIW